jgi:xylulokinase
MGTMQAAGGARDWLLGQIGEIPEDEVGQVAPGANGLLFLPYLIGERSPWWNPKARGAFVGLTMSHSRAEMTRAVLEGVSYGLRDSLELMRALGITATQVRASGGGARSAVWRQILADIFDTEIVTVNVTEGAAFGAALLAGVGAGVYRDVKSACEAAIKITACVAPSDDKRVYAAHYPRYRALYPALKPIFATIAKPDHGNFAQKLGEKRTSIVAHPQSVDGENLG